MATFIKKLFLSKPKTQHKAYSQSQLKEIIVVLRYSRHCKHCSLEVKRSCEKMKGVTRVALDDENSLVTVEGAFDVDKLVKHIRKRNDKIVTIVEQRSGGEDHEEDGSSSIEDHEEDGSSSIYPSYRGGYDSIDDDLESFHRYH